MAPAGKAMDEAQRELSIGRHANLHKEMVGPGRLELPTSRLSGVRSNQLSYGPMTGARYALELDPTKDLVRPWVRDQTAQPERLAMGGKRSEDGGALHLCSALDD